MYKMEKHAYKMAKVDLSASDHAEDVAYADFGESVRTSFASRSSVPRASSMINLGMDDEEV